MTVDIPPAVWPILIPALTLLAAAMTGVMQALTLYITSKIKGQTDGVARHFQEQADRAEVTRQHTAEMTDKNIELADAKRNPPQ